MRITLPFEMSSSDPVPTFSLPVSTRKSDLSLLPDLMEVSSENISLGIFILELWAGEAHYYCGLSVDLIEAFLPGDYEYSD